MITSLSLSSERINSSLTLMVKKRRASTCGARGTAWVCCIRACIAYCARLFRINMIPMYSFVAWGKVLFYCCPVKCAGNLLWLARFLGWLVVRALDKPWLAVVLRQTCLRFPYRFFRLLISNLGAAVRSWVIASIL